MRATLEFERSGLTIIYSHLAILGENKFPIIEKARNLLKIANKNDDVHTEGTILLKYLKI